MSRTTLGVADILIDDDPRTFSGSFQLDQETTVIASKTATRPDPSWTTVDDSGHFHTYGLGEDLPTLVSRARHVECDGIHDDGVDACNTRCVGYDVTDWRCRICEQRIEPGRLLDSGPHQIPGPVTWFAEFTVPGDDLPAPVAGLVAVRTLDVAVAVEVTVRLRVGGRLYFGVCRATVAGYGHSSDDDSWTTLIRLDGGMLGERNVHGLDPFVLPRAVQSLLQQPQQ